MLNRRLFTNGPKCTAALHISRPAWRTELTCEKNKLDSSIHNFHQRCPSLTRDPNPAHTRLFIILFMCDETITRMSFKFLNRFVARCDINCSQGCVRKNQSHIVTDIDPNRSNTWFTLLPQVWPPDACFTIIILSVHSVISSVIGVRNEVNELPQRKHRERAKQIWKKLGVCWCSAKINTRCKASRSADGFSNYECLNPEGINLPSLPEAGQLRRIRAHI